MILEGSGRVGKISRGLILLDNGFAKNLSPKIFRPKSSGLSPEDFGRKILAELVQLSKMLSTPNCTLCCGRRYVIVVRLLISLYCSYCVDDDAGT